MVKGRMKKLYYYKCNNGEMDNEVCFACVGVRTSNKGTIYRTLIWINICPGHEKHGSHFKWPHATRRPSSSARTVRRIRTAERITEGISIIVRRLNCEKETKLRLWKSDISVDQWLFELFKKWRSERTKKLRQNEVVYNEPYKNHFVCV